MSLSFNETEAQDFVNALHCVFRNSVELIAQTVVVVSPFCDSSTTYVLAAPAKGLEPSLSRLLRENFALKNSVLEAANQLID